MTLSNTALQHLFTLTKKADIADPSFATVITAAGKNRRTRLINAAPAPH